MTHPSSLKPVQGRRVVGRQPVAELDTLSKKLGVKVVSRSVPIPFPYLEPARVGYYFQKQRLQSRRRLSREPHAGQFRVDQRCKLIPNAWIIVNFVAERATSGAKQDHFPDQSWMPGVNLRSATPRAGALA